MMVRFHKSMVMTGGLAAVALQASCVAAPYDAGASDAAPGTAHPAPEPADTRAAEMEAADAEAVATQAQAFTMGGPLAFGEEAETDFERDVADLETSVAGSTDSRRDEDLASVHDALLPPSYPEGTGGHAPHRFGLHRHRLLCQTLQKYLGSRHSRPMFFVGASGQAGAVVQAFGGADLVWDLYNQQFAAFKYAGGGLGNFVAVSGGAYVGFAFGKTDDIVQAWAGSMEALTVSASVPVVAAPVGVGLWYTWAGDRNTLGVFLSLPPPLTPVGLSMAFTTARDGLSGFVFGVSAGVSLALPMPVEVSYLRGRETAWERGTALKYKVDRALSLPAHVATTRVEDAPATYIQYDGPSAKARSRAIAKSVLAATGPIGAPAALVALAVGALKDARLDADQACR